MYVLVKLKLLQSGLPPGTFFTVNLDGWCQSAMLNTDSLEALRMDERSKIKFELSNIFGKTGKRTFTLAKLIKNQTEDHFQREIKFRVGIVLFQVDLSWSPEDRAAFFQTFEAADPAYDDLRELGCHDVFLQDLQQLRGFDIVMICDDSGSMKQRTENGTRWSELKDSVEALVKLCVKLDPDGIDIEFLNRKGRSNVKDAKSVKKLFKDGPSGSTRLAEAFARAVARKSQRPMLIIIATDGEPDSMSSFVAQLRRRPEDVYVSFLACTDSEKEVAYLDRLDNELPRVDVLDDYFSEREQVRLVHPQADYTLGDHCARMLLGPVFEKYDNLDLVSF